MNFSRPRPPRDVDLSRRGSLRGDTLAEYPPETDDGIYASQWQWEAVDAPRAWAVTRGAGVTVAVIDNGMNLQHPYLQHAVRHGAAHFVDGKLRTWAAGDSGYRPSDHGTACAGMISARPITLGAKHLGGTGIAPDAVLLPVTVDDVLDDAALAAAIVWAATVGGADVISCSLTGAVDGHWKGLSTGVSDALATAARYGRGGRGTLIFWAAANNPQCLVAWDEVCSHPAVIAVGASDATGVAGPSAQGVALVAPGVRVVTTAPSVAWFAPVSGTSVAAPLAAGVAALVLACNNNLDATTVRQCLQETCDPPVPVTSQTQAEQGAGRVNAGQAVAYAQRFGRVRPA